MSGLIPTTASLTTVFKNVYDITTGIIGSRKQNKLIAAGQLRLLGNAIQQAVERERMAGMHHLMVSGRKYLIDSYNQIKEYANTDFGDMLLESLQRECRYYYGYCEDYDRMTRMGGIK